MDEEYLIGFEGYELSVGTVIDRERYLTEMYRRHVDVLNVSRRGWKWMECS